MLRGIAMGCLGLAAGAVLAQERPNIVFVFTDDHAWQAIPAYGGFLKDVAKTPNLDRLAREGLRFERAYVTNALCGPSRAVIQTGKYSHLNGFTRNEGQAPFDASQPTFPKLLRRHGYQTAVIGKWHLESDPQGFDYWDVLPGQGDYYNPQMIRGDSSGRKQSRRINGYNSDIIGDLALDWLGNVRDKGKPFLLMYQFKATHRRWEPGPDHVSLYQGVRIPEPKNLFDTFRYRGSAVHFQDMTIRRTMDRMDVKLADPLDFPSWTAEQKSKWNAYYNLVKQDFRDRGFDFADMRDDGLVRWKYQRYMEDYLSVAYQMDQNVGRLLDYLERNGLSRNTLVVYSSDQGFYLGEHGWFDKRFMFEESLKTPLIVRWPGVVKPGTVDTGHIVSNVDFPETFLEAAGAPVPADMQGRSLLPLLKGQAPADWRKSFYYQYYEGPPATHRVYRHYGVTTGRYKLVYYHDVDEWEFYDRKKDPEEMINQYYIPGNAAKIQELKAELARLRAELKVPADPPRQALETIELEKWTSVLPVKGCTDRQFVEFDPEATESLPGACKVPVAIREGGRTGREGGVAVAYVPGSRRVSFDASGMGARGVSLSIHRPDGALLENLAGGPRFQWDVAGITPGVYVVEIRAGGLAQYLKFRI